MTKLTRLRLLVGSILGNNLTGMIAVLLFVFPVPVAIWLGSATLEAIGLLPETIAVYFVCLVPMWTGVILATALWLIDVWTKRA